MSYPTFPFEPGNFYHIYHQGNSGESIFKCDENFRYFLEKYAIYPDNFTMLHQKQIDKTFLLEPEF